MINSKMPWRVTISGERQQILSLAFETHLCSLLPPGVHLGLNSQQSPALPAASPLRSQH